MKRYSAFAIAKEAFSYHQGWERAWRSPAPKERYDVIVIGAGGHGLATAGGGPVPRSGHGVRPHPAPLPREIRHLIVSWRHAVACRNAA